MTCRPAQFFIFSFLALFNAPALPQHESGPPPIIKLYVLDCGRIEITEASWVSPAIPPGQKKVFADSCYLIVHRKGLLLWDTGLPDALVTTSRGVVKQDAIWSVQKTLVSQLYEIGYKPNDIGLVGFSHMHPDHTGNANLFSHSVILMQKEEYDAAFGPEPGKYQFDPETYEGLKNSKFVRLQGDHDIFGDGTVIIKRAPGHTPGHQMLYLDLPRTGGVLLSGDMVHSTDNWINKRVPSFNFDKELSVQTMKEADAFLKQKRAQLWIQHDLEQNSTINHAPLYYE